MHHATTIAQRLIDLAHRDSGNTHTPMQLLKLVYIAHGYMLGTHGRPLICDDVEVWKYGPIIKPLYDKIQRYRSQPVTKVHLFLFAFPTDLSEDEEAIIAQVSNTYGRVDGISLSTLTHKQGTPWHTAWKNKSMTISNDLIEHYYRHLLGQQRAGVVKPEA